MERSVHLLLLLYLEVVQQNVAKLCNVWNRVLSQGGPFIADKCLLSSLAAAWQSSWLKVAPSAHFLQL